MEKALKYRFVKEMEEEQPERLKKTQESVIWQNPRKERLLRKIEWITMLGTMITGKMEVRSVSLTKGVSMGMMVEATLKRTETWKEWGLCMQMIQNTWPWREAEDVAIVLGKWGIEGMLVHQLGLVLVPNDRKHNNNSLN